MSNQNLSKRRLRAILGCAVSSPEQAQDEKQSLETQERLLREVAAREGWDVVDVLIIPGFSRRYYNFPEFMEASLREGHDAPSRLWQHWMRRDFDVLAWRYGNRFAREQSIFGEIVARTIDQGALMYTLQDGWIDKSNYRMFIAMGGYAAATEVDKLVAGRIEGMKRRAERGLRTGPSVVVSHLPVFDEKGKETGVRVDESKRQLWDDVATLLLEGVSWSTFEAELYNRFGHTRQDGRPYPTRAFYVLLHLPVFWGHTAWNYRPSGQTKITRQSFWPLEEGHEVPDGVTVYYNTHDPVYTGEQAEAVKAELKRRRDFMKGHASPRHTKPFTGLLVCEECGFLLSYYGYSKRNYEAYRCISHYFNPLHYPERAKCSQRGQLSLKVIQEWIEDWLRPALQTRRAETLFRVQSTQARIEQLQSEVQDADKHLRNLVNRWADAEGRAAAVLGEEVRRAEAHLEHLEQLLAAERAREHERAKVESQQQRALEQIAEMGLAAFWKQDRRIIHQQLVNLFGEWRMVVADKEILGVEYKPGNSR